MLIFLEFKIEILLILYNLFLFTKLNNLINITFMFSEGFETYSEHINSNKLFME
jgi:hypothetical protein